MKSITSLITATEIVADRSISNIATTSVSSGTTATTTSSKHFGNRNYQSSN